MDSTPSDEAAAWCLLLRAPGIGCQTLNPLLTTGTPARQIVERPPAGVPPALRDYLRDPDWRGAEADMRWLEGPRNHLLPITDPAYPALLRELPAPPSALFLHGDPELLALPQIAIVGSRNPSTGGRRNAHSVWSSGLCQHYYYWVGLHLPSFTPSAGSSTSKSLRNYANVVKLANKSALTKNPCRVSKNPFKLPSLPREMV